MQFIQWLVPGILAVSCLSTAVSAWKPAGRMAAQSRRSLLAAVLEVAFVAVALRLVIQWSPGAVALWAVSVAALAAAVAGLIIRWDVLPETPQPASAAAGTPTAGEQHDAEGPESHHGTSLVLERPGRIRRRASARKNSARKNSARENSARKKRPKQLREPGTAAVAGRGVLLIGAVALSVAVSVGF